ncbi:cysteine--tRNA ligase [Nanoarchaeota archaeon]
MALQFYNTLGRKKEVFKELVKGKVSMYSCGPTVYNYVHLGNLRAYVFVDLLRRYLKYKGFELKHVMNITDVDDKTIKNSKNEGKTLKEFTDFYTEKFLEDMKTLNIEIPKIMPKAVDTIQEMVDLVKKLLDKGVAYKSDDGSIYFSIEKFKDYGKLALLDLEKLKEGASGRVSSDEYEKESAHDFALWKSYSEDDGDVFWETELGKGRPGWHIECSAMSTKFLGETIDIHTGGIDLIFPHHTNEIAQSECASGKEFVKYWLHNEHLIVNGEKMSKSLGNFYTLRDLLNKGYNTMAIRYELLSTHYRQKLDFGEDRLKQIPETLQKFYDFLDKLDEADGSGQDISGLISEAEKKFEESLDDDLNISGALAAVFDFMKEINKVMPELSKDNADKVKQTMEKFDSVLGIMQHEKTEVPKEIQELADKREQARKDKDFATADKLRDELKEKGYVIEDTDKGPRVKKV